MTAMIRQMTQIGRGLWRGLRWLTTGAAVLALLFVAVWVGQSTWLAWRLQSEQASVHAVEMNDQLDRYAAMFTPVGLVVTGVAGDARDAARREAVREIAQRGGLQTGDDYAAAALVFQHGNTPADYQQANRYAEQAIDLGSERGRQLYALTRDRYLRSIGEPQQFGTQYRLESGTWQLVLQPYDPTTTDAERARYNVPPLARLQAGPPGGMNSPLLLLLIQMLVLVGLVRLAWLGVRWLWRRSTRRKQAAATATEAG
jgi:hypothetical protein